MNASGSPEHDGVQQQVGATGAEIQPTQDTFFDAAAPSPMFDSMAESFMENFDPNINFDMSTPPYLREMVRSRIEPDSVTSSLESLFEDTNFLPSTSQSSLTGSPGLMDLLMSGSDMGLQAPDPIQPMSQPFTFQSEMMPSFDDEIEEIIRHPNSMENAWPLRTPIMSVHSSRVGSPMLERRDPFSRMIKQMEVPAGSPEMLMVRFDKQTCGILSVKDGPNENPWRTLIWPLARDCPALYHAIASMTAFHTSKEKPELRVNGMDHMRQSIRQLGRNIGSMRKDTALATTLVLAFSESWDQHISTGIEHLRGAKILVLQALAESKRQALQGDDLARLKFLCNTWIYMDVISRLTSVDDDISTDFDNIMQTDCGLFGPEKSEVDPLMGCAVTLFPLIGRVANLCRKVCSSEQNSIVVISQAIELKEAIQQWQPDLVFEDPEDPSSNVQHALQTAEAYRYATLLYLHQAVPEIPSLTTAQLANKVLTKLATVPPSSRLVIVQIYPLLAAGCEATEAEDREWVEARWAAMDKRMWIGNVEKCWLVTQEVWRRKADAEKAKGALTAKQQSTNKKDTNEMSMDDIFSYEELLNGTSNVRARKPRYSAKPVPKKEMEATEDVDPEMTVRGRMHWVGVMKDWNWEGEEKTCSTSDISANMLTVLLG